MIKYNLLIVYLFFYNDIVSNINSYVKYENEMKNETYTINVKVKLINLNYYKLRFIEVD